MLIRIDNDGELIVVQYFKELQETLIEDVEKNVFHLKNELKESFNKLSMSIVENCNDAIDEYIKNRI